MKTENLIMLAALGAAAFMLTRKVTAGQAVGTKNAAPLLWAQNPTSANQPSSTKANVAVAGLGLLSSLFGGKSSAAWTPTYTGWQTPDYSFNTGMLSTSSPSSQADLFALNPAPGYYGQGIDTSFTEGTWWDTTP